jgi:KUP system potassium uptake protein
LSADHGRKNVPALTLTALGVVYGDIGTSPVYAMRECFHGVHAVPPTHENVLGVLSLIVYALLLVVSLKYIAVVMRADNQGEGAILALTALLPQRATASRRLLVLLGVFGAALLYGDGMITPAITVLGAVEGLNVAPRCSSGMWCPSPRPFSWPSLRCNGSGRTAWDGHLVR